MFFCLILCRVTYKRGEMVYKKYIERNGKVYGPYTYHSQRVNGKVVSEYHGKKKRNLDFIWALIGLVGILFIVFFVNRNSFSMQGFAVLESESFINENGIVDGVLKLSLQKGELLPIDSKLIIENSGETYEYLLSDLISDFEIGGGNYFLNNKNLQGNGEGFGVAGEKKIYPELDFVLIVSQEVEETQTEVSEENSEENSIEEGSNEEETASESSEEETEIIENVEEENQEDVEESPTESIETPEETASESENSESLSEETSEAPITGNVIFNLIGSFTRFFKLTGNAVYEDIAEVDGVVSYENNFVYSLQDGQTASIKPASVVLNGEVLDSEVLTLEKTGNEILVSTDYFEIENGFGEDYILNEIGEKIEIDLTELGLNISGDTTIKIIFEGEDFFSFFTFISENISSFVEGELEIPEEILEENQTFVENFTYEKLSLSEYEKNILENEFGNISIKTTKAEVVNNRLLIKYEFGNYWAEFSYSYSGFVEEDLQFKIENDRVKWLKDISSKILSETQIIEKEQVEELIQDYAL